MTESVYHVGYGIELDLSLDDLGHPDRPGLWDEIYRPKRFQHGLLRCTGVRGAGTECREAMYVMVRHGKRIACHVNSSIGPHAPQEGPRHKALKERIAVSAQRAGFEAVLEEGSASGPSRRTDVLVKGHGGRAIGWEVQFRHVTADAVRRRSRRAHQRGVTPMWTVDDRKSEAVDRAPWTRLDRVTDWRQIAGRHLNVRGGVRELRMERCDERRATPCPELGRGRCGGWHACWDLALGVYLDDLIARTAGGEYVPLFLPPRPAAVATTCGSQRRTRLSFCRTGRTRRRGSSMSVSTTAMTTSLVMTLTASLHSLAEAVATPANASTPRLG